MGAHDYALEFLQTERNCFPVLPELKCLKAYALKMFVNDLHYNEFHISPCKVNVGVS